MLVGPTLQKEGHPPSPYGAQDGINAPHQILYLERS